MVSRNKILTLFFLLNCCNCLNAQKQKPLVSIIFENNIQGVPLVLDSVAYTNTFGETYHISKLKYYISNIVLSNEKTQFAEKESYHLIDAAKPGSEKIGIAAPKNIYTTLSFTIGVDSIKNVSGAQTGALDLTNGMFWTWNSGYIMFKMEGNSPSSKIVNNKIEYHIGGFSGENNVVKKIVLKLPQPIKLEKETQIFIGVDIDKIWQGAYNLKIAENPAVMAPGILAKKIAENYWGMFYVNSWRVL